jgi:fumarylacetoacetase
MTRGGRNPVALANGETRTYLEDGDEIIFLGQAHRAGYASIGFGECRGTVTEALPLS